jgi:hypothetical protein
MKRRDEPISAILAVTIEDSRHDRIRGRFGRVETAEVNFGIRVTKDPMLRNEKNETNPSLPFWQEQVRLDGSRVGIEAVGANPLQTDSPARHSA